MSHQAYIALAFGVAAVAFGGMLAKLLLDHRALKAALHRLGASAQERGEQDA